MEHPIKMDDLVVPPFKETPILLTESFPAPVCLIHEAKKLEILHVFLKSLM